MIFGSAQAHVVEEVLLVVQCHVNAELLENRHESLVANQVISPVLQLAFAFETQAIKYLWLNVMPLEDL